MEKIVWKKKKKNCQFFVTEIRGNKNITSVYTAICFSLKKKEKRLKIHSMYRNMIKKANSISLNYYNIIVQLNKLRKKNEFSIFYTYKHLFQIRNTIRSFAISFYTCPCT